LGEENKSGRCHILYKRRKEGWETKRAYFKVNRKPLITTTKKETKSPMVE